MYLGRDLRSGRSEVFHYTSTSGGETSISTSTDGRSINYTVGWCAVYLNGIRLHDSDITVTSGTSVGFTSALSEDDVVIIEAAHTFSVDSSVPSTGGTFGGAVTFSAVPVFSAGVGAVSGTTVTASGLITANGGIETDTNSKVVQKGAFMQSSTHQALTLGG